MKIVVIGGSGLIGTKLVNEFRGRASRFVLTYRGLIPARAARQFFALSRKLLKEGIA